MLGFSGGMCISLLSATFLAWGSWYLKTICICDLALFPAPEALKPHFNQPIEQVSKPLLLCFSLWWGVPRSGLERVWEGQWEEAELQLQAWFSNPASPVIQVVLTSPPIWFLSLYWLISNTLDNDLKLWGYQSDDQKR